MRLAKVLLALVSVLVLGITGFAWAKLGGLNNGLSTADVLDNGAGGDQPADGSVDILLVGMDSRTDAQGHPLDPALLDRLHAGGDDGEGNTDTMILVHIPNGGGQAIGLSLPRDSLVNIPGYGKAKLNSAYTSAKDNAAKHLKARGVTDQAQIEVQSNQVGAKELIQTVEDFTGITIDHYAQVNLVGFYDISEAIGGVPVCLKQAVSDPEYSGAHFTKGQQEVQGADALAFVRQRHNIPGGSTDLQRERRQQAFLASMAHKVLSAGVLANPAQLASLVDAVKKTLVIDQNWNLFKFAQQMQGLATGQLSFSTIPVVNIDAHSPVYGDYVQVDPDQVRAYVRHTTGVQDDSSGTPRTAATPSQPSGDPANAAITVEVSNATGRDGLAGNVLTALTDNGFSSGSTSNASSRLMSVIRYPSGGRANAQKVATALGGGFTLEQDSTVTPGYVQVVLGTDYMGPGSTGGGSTSSSLTPPGGVTSGTPSAPPQQPITDTGGGPTCVD